MKTVKLIIDGRQVYAGEEITILEAARENGIHIPTLCYHSHLRPLGRCRLCLVEVEGLEKPITACDNPVREGMVVTTDTPALRRAREEILTLLLSTHPARDCLTCEKSGDCELQEKAYSLGTDIPDQLERPVLPGLNEEDPFIVRDEQKCILCGRCMQVCREGAGAFVYSQQGRGLATRVVPVDGMQGTTLEKAGCIHCGQCVDVCPVGALTERSRMGIGREWEFRSAPGVCLECALGCPVERQVIQGKPVRVVPTWEGERFGGLCKKGRFPADEPGERLLSPLVREGGELQEADYDQAVRRAKEAFLRIKQKNGGSSLAILADGKCSNEESYIYQKLARAGFGSNHIDLGVVPGWVKAAVALHKLAGPLCGPRVTDLSESTAPIFVLGGDPEQTHPVAAMAIRKASRFYGAPVVWIGYEAAEDTHWADLKLAPAEGRLEDLLAGIIAAKEGRSYSHLAERCGVNPEQMALAARWYSSCPYTLVTPSFYNGAGEERVAVLLKLVQSGGALEQGKTNLWLLPPAGNARGILENGGTPLYLPGYYSIGDNEARKRVQDVWGVLPPPEIGYYREQVLKAASEGKIKGLLLIGDWKDEDWGGLEFLAVVTSCRNKIPRNADVVFPALPLLEKEGNFTNASGRCILNLPAEKPGVTEDWDIALRLLRALGGDSNYHDLKALREESRQVSGKA